MSNDKRTSNETSRSRARNENISKDELRAIIWEIKQKQEEAFQEELKKMTPEEREKAIEFADHLL